MCIMMNNFWIVLNCETKRTNTCDAAFFNNIDWSLVSVIIARNAPIWMELVSNIFSLSCNSVYVFNCCCVWNVFYILQSSNLTSDRVKVLLGVSNCHSDSICRMSTLNTSRRAYFYCSISTRTECVIGIQLKKVILATFVRETRVLCFKSTNYHAL